MSRVKKSIVYFVVLALTLVTLAGCGDTEKENEFVGSWEVSSGKDGITVSEKDGANKVLFKREGDKLAGNIKGIEVVLKK